MLKSINYCFRLDELIKFKTIEKLTVFIAIEYTLFAIIMLAI